jgi:hypothetical protein
MNETPEQCARHILRLIVGHFHGQPGRVLTDASLLRIFSSDGWKAAGYQLGLLHAVEHGWVSAASDTLTLTTAGFAAAFARDTEQNPNLS